jgi:hypothetical protein
LPALSAPAAVEVSQKLADNSSSTMKQDCQQFAQNNGPLTRASTPSGSNKVSTSAEVNECPQGEESAL